MNEYLMGFLLTIDALCWYFVIFLFAFIRVENKETSKLGGEMK